jgi:rfaE bifunctional protein kinase chain/domain
MSPNSFVSPQEAVSRETDRAIAEIAARIAPHDRVVFVSGDFNIIHPGHLRLFNFAAECGDFLVVGIHGDGLGKTLVPEALRLESVSAIGVVNHAVVLRVPPHDFIAKLRPHLVVKGREHSSHYNVEQPVVESYGGKLLFCSGEISFSSRDLLKSGLSDINFDSIHKPTDYPARHNFTFKDLTHLVGGFSSLRVMVLGDLIVDEYVDCAALGMSREDPTLVVTPILSEQFVGGAGIVAGHARGLGAQVSYFGVCGADGPSHFARSHLEAQGVELHLLEDSTRPTTLKQRFRSSGKTLLRVSHLRQHDISGELIEAMAAQIEAQLTQTDLVIFSDFNYGCLPQSLVDRVIAGCRSRGVPMAADSQASSQVSDISRFLDMKLLTPTEHEARLAVRDFQSGLVVLADLLRDKARAEAVIITLAAEGVLIHSPDDPSGLVTDRLPAFNSTPRDVSGAGDSFLTCASMALALGADIWKAAYLGSVAAACQVRRLGNRSLLAHEVIEELIHCEP